MCVVEQESGLKVNQPASFAVSLNGAKGAIDAKVHSPSGALEECCVTEIDQGNQLPKAPSRTETQRLLPYAFSACLDKYAVRFIPRENGLYLIDVKFNGSHIPGSPFKIRVGETGQAGDPGMVSAYGAGLEGGTTGNTAERQLGVFSSFSVCRYVKPSRSASFTSRNFM